MTQRPEADLKRLLDGLVVRSAEGVVELDRPGALGAFPSATLRGLVGHLLTETAPELTGAAFKPGHGNSIPAAFVLQGLTASAPEPACFAFRLITWDAEGALLDVLAKAVEQGPGRAFGEGGATVRQIRLLRPMRTCFDRGACTFPRAVDIVCATPTRVRYHQRWVNAEDLGVAHIARAAVLRLNSLSQHYGNGVQMETDAFCALAAFARETRRRMHWTHFRRRSTTQGRGIALSGVVGGLRVEGVAPPLNALLGTLDHFHVGRHVSAGCGHIKLEAVR